MPDKIIPGQIPLNEYKVFLDRESYDAFEALNYSGSKKILISPQHFLHARTEKFDSPAMKLGRAVHSAILEPELFLKNFAVVPKIDRRTKEGKEKWAELEKELEGKEILTEEDHATVKEIERKVIALKLKQNIAFEHTELKVAFSLSNGICLKSSFDAVGEDGYIYDIKTTDDASPRAFLRSVRNFDYHLQAAFYSYVFFFCYGQMPKGFRFIAVEKEGPGIAIYELGKNALNEGRELMNLAVEIYSNAISTGDWPGLPEDPQVLDF